MKLDIPSSAFEQLGRSPEVTDEIMRLTEIGAAVAQTHAPVDSGDYKAGIRPELRRGKGRNVGRVTFSDPKSLLVESKTGNAHRTLRAMRGG